ncbi:hypothetical protein [Thermoanaerobacter sp. A7A]|uniref:hypothetical protein n=1 Tax=Thermoanaerobacter sp. A7A TaxID=1350366 RepID=UPI000420AF26|nr:hypothetical protein [Thermoanaerobacter sp. A7A]
MKKIMLVILCLILVIPNYVVFAKFLSSQIIEEENIKNTIESFYNAQYDAYLQIQYKDITPYLDMTKKVMHFYIFK